MKTNLRRRVRYHGAVEWILSRARRTSAVAFPELGLTVSLGPSDVAIDCGAHVGDITSRLARTGATVHAFEPNPGCFAILSERFSRMSNVILHNNGVMERVGEFELRVPIDDDPTKAAVAGTFLADADAFEQDERRVTVKCISLPDFIVALGRPVKLLKMDIEGSEVAILNTMLDRQQIASVDMAIVETHDRFSDRLARETDALRARLAAEALTDKIRLDWI